MDINPLIDKVEYIRVFESTTICAIRLTNGFCVVGKSSVLDANTFDAAMGEKQAYENASRQIYDLLAFKLLSA